MALPIWSSLASIFRVFSRTAPGGGKIEEDFQARDIPKADEAQQHELTQEPGKAVGNGTYVTFFDDSDNGEDSKLHVETMSKKIEEACKKHGTSRMMDLPVHCAKCNISFRTVKERTHHIRHSLRYYCRLRGEGMVELKDPSDLSPHNVSYHF